MKFKKFIFVVAIILSSAICRADSLETFSTGINEPSKIHFITQDQGYICGSGGIYVTYNAGINWFLRFGTINTQDTNHGINDFEFLDNGIAYAVGWRSARINDTLWRFDGLIIKSTNYGMGWFDVMTSNIGVYTLKEWKEKISIVENRKNLGSNFLFSVACVTSQIVTVSGNQNSIFRTTDGGANWEESTTSWNSINTLVYYNSILYGGEYNKLAKSTNQGVSWSFTPSDPGSMISSIFFLGNKIFVAGRIGDNISYSYTTNEGTSWSSVILSDSGSFTDVFFLNDNIGYATASRPMVWGIWNSPMGYILKTENGGLSWQIIFRQEWCEMVAICKNQQYIFFLGSNRVKRLPLNLTGTNGIELTTSSFELCQNYPNPFNPVTKIKYQIQKLTQVVLNIFDISGRELSTLVKQRQNSGVYEVAFDGSNLSSGTYFYRLQAGDFIETKKMMLIK